MKSKILAVAGLCMTIGFATGQAQAQTDGLLAKVPFSFSVAGKTFPAGDYIMRASLYQLKIEDANRETVAMVLATNGANRTAGKQGQIIFHCYKNRCFLAEVWCPTQENALALFASRVEANLAKQEQGKYFAVLAEEPLKRH